MKRNLCLVLFSFFIFSMQANIISSNAANRKTALRYLQLAKNYVTQSDWVSVKKSCESGLQYDETVADLHYLKALSLYNLDFPRYEIIPVIKKSLDKTEWVDYNLANARVFYADLMCSTGKPQEAIDVLDKAPLIYSSDAEYVRIKSLYEMNTAESIAKAEEKLNSARRVYPNDVRFFYLFFNYEYNICYIEKSDKSGFEKKELSPLAKKIASSFIVNLPNYDKDYKDLEILASFFAEGENQKRLLKAFDARGFKHILYPVIALETGVLSQEDALDYFLTFFDGKIEAKILFQFYLMITEENIKKYFDENLNAFSGTLVYDTNNNLEENLIVKYERGRARQVTFDFDNDQYAEWNVECDFGVPKKINVYDQNALVVYGTYPNVNSIVFEDVEENVKGLTVYNIIDEMFVSKPFDIVKAQEINSSDFYVIDDTSLLYGKALFDSDKILAATNKMTKPSLERKNAKIEFSVLDGIPYKAIYYADEKKYAESFFIDDSICVIRNVDKDDDGIFETTEYYSTDDGSMNISETDKKSVTTNIWGSPVLDAPLYLYGIKIDRNLDTVPDFSETYLANNGKITEWDSDFDGQNDIVYHKFPAEKDKPLREEHSYFIKDIVKGSYWVTTVLEDEKPVSIIENENTFTVFRGKNDSFFWIGQKESDGYELNILGQISQFAQGQVFQMEESDCYIRVVRMGKNIFARKIEKAVSSEESSDGVEDFLSGENSEDEIK